MSAPATSEEGEDIQGDDVRLNSPVGEASSFAVLMKRYPSSESPLSELFLGLFLLLHFIFLLSACYRLS